MYKVFYTLYKGARARQIDAYRYTPKGFVGIAPKNWKEEKEGKKIRKSTFKGRLAKFLPFLLKEKEYEVKGDLIYTFCSLLKNPKIPYFVEIDNPACLTYYSPISLMNPLIKRKVKEKIKEENFGKFLAMSEAAKKGLINALGEEMEEKIEVVYPPFPYKIKSEENEEVNFIFISYNFWIKGGREILNAVKKLNGKFKMTMISDMPKNYQKNAEKLNVEVMKKIEREKLLNLISKNDVIIHPSYMDSFGIAPYEAINIGLAGISTDMYALPEFITDKNGFVFESPIKYFNEKYLPNFRFWLFSVEEYVKKRNFPHVEKKLVEYMQYYIDNPKELKKHKKQSKKLAEKRFSIEIRNKKLEKIFKEALE